MEDNFTLCQGVSVGGAEKLRSCCHIQGDTEDARFVQTSYLRKRTRPL